MTKLQYFVRNSRLDFFTSKFRPDFTKLSQVFIKVSIIHNFKLKYYIYIIINVFGYVIDKVFNPLTLDNLSQWHLVVFFSKKMIPVET